MAVSLTPSALERVKRLQREQHLEHAFLRMGVKGGGCSGHSYNLEFDTELGKHDKDLKKLYVKAEGRSRVNAVEDGLASLFERPALAYRGRKLFDDVEKTLCLKCHRMGDREANQPSSPRVSLFAR